MVAGDAKREEFERMLSPVLDTAFRVALRYTKSRDDAADLVQEASLKAYKGFHTFESDSNFKAWFLRILTNTYFRARRASSLDTVPIDGDEVSDIYLFTHAQATGQVSDEGNPSASLLAKLDLDTIAKAIDGLPEEYRAAITLNLIEDFSYEEIANILDCPLGTVRSRIHRGRNLLQKALADEFSGT